MSLLDKIEKYNFECEAGNLISCQEWLDLKDKLKKLWCIGRGDSILQHIISSDGSSVLSVYSTEQAAQERANVLNNKHYDGNPILSVKHFLN